MGISFPIIKRYEVFNSIGRTFVVEIIIKETEDYLNYFPEGKKCIFRLFREKIINSREFELVLLIDNHAPYGFHIHNKLPEIHDSRVGIKTSDWKEAWYNFDKFTKELMDET